MTNFNRDFRFKLLVATSWIRKKPSLNYIRLFLFQRFGSTVFNFDFKPGNLNEERNGKRDTFV